MGLARLEALGLENAGLPNEVFAYEFGDISPVEQAGFAREYGFAGTVFDHVRDIPERLRALDEAHLQLFFLWLTVDLSHGGTKYEPGMEAAIEALAGRGTVVWVALQEAEAGAEERAVQAVDRISGLASQANLRVALYPHYGFYLARFKDVVRLAERVGRSNVGVTFNLCHELRSGIEPRSWWAGSRRRAGPKGQCSGLSSASVVPAKLHFPDDHKTIRAQKWRW